MKVKRLKIQSFRGIDEMTLEFNPRVAVLIGNNGVGKSSILDCLTILLSSLTGRIQSPNSSGRFFNKTTDIKNNRRETRNHITILLKNKEISWSRAISQNRQSANLEELRLPAQELRKQLEENSKLNLPLAVFYPTNRAVLDIPLRIRKKHEFSQIEIYENSLSGGKIEFRTFFEWFRNREDLENESFRIEVKKNPKIKSYHGYQAYLDPQLNAVRSAIASLLPEFSELQVKRSPLRMMVEKQGKELSIDQLSDGEKCLLAMVGDIARRLAIANPGLANPLEGEGVVLIDEIELHLHPQWQRGIIPKLTTTFPNCQFIVTTHSPQVISDVKPENVYILESTSEGIKAFRPKYSFGRDSNSILEDLMDVSERPKEIKESIQELFRLIELGDLDAARKNLDELANKIGADEADLVGARAAIRRREIIGH